MSLEGTAAHDRVEVLANAFDLEGQSRSSERQTLEISRGGNVEVLSRLALAPGRYELRIGVQPGDGLPGRVYASLEVPDFAGERISLSGLVLARDDAPPPAGLPAGAPDYARELANLLPVVPTAAREFSRSDRVTAFVRVYQGGGPRPASVSARIVNDHDEIVLDETTAMDAERFDPQRAAQHRVALPLARCLRRCVLTIEAALGKDHARRDAGSRSDSAISPTRSLDAVAHSAITVASAAPHRRG